MEKISPIIERSAANTREYFREKYNVSTENNCAAGGVRFIYDLMKSYEENFSTVFQNAFLIKAYMTKEEKFKTDPRSVFDTGTVIQTNGFFYSVFFGDFEGGLVCKSPDIKTMMADFRESKPGPWPDGEIVETLFTQIKKPTIRSYHSPFEKIGDDDDYPVSCRSEIINLDAIVKRDGQTTIKPYSEIFLKLK